MKKNSIYGHLVFWIIILVLGTATVYPYYQDLRLAFINRAFFLPVWLVATYINWYILMPRLLSTGKVIRYAVFLLLLLFLLTVIQRFVAIEWFFPAFFNNDKPVAFLPEIFRLGRFIQFAAFIALPVFLSIGMRFLIKWYRESYQARQILAQQQTAELNYLKAQINPHFLFNTLNNLYGLSLEESKKVPEMILKLSDVLSYSLYESSAEKIPLYKELKMIKDFIDLEKERYEDRMKVTIKEATGLNESIEIAPLLLIPLVENAFKHGVKEATDIIPIVIDISQKENWLSFEVRNKMSNELPEKGNKNKGLGLKNLQRRLNLLYPNKHTFETDIEGDLFYAKLKVHVL